MGGKDSDLFFFFKILMAKGLQALTTPKNIKRIEALLMICSQFSDLDCFQGFRFSNFWKRFKPDINETEVSERVIIRDCPMWRD